MGRDGIRRTEVVANVGALGPVVFFDNCDGVLKWTGDGTGGDWSCAKETTVVYMGDASVKMQTRATTPAKGDTVEASLLSYKTMSNRLTFDVVFKFDSIAKTDNIMFRIQSDDNAFTVTYAVRYDVQNDKLQYQDSAGAWQDINAAVGNLQEGCWHRLSFEVDVIEQKYMYCTLNGNRATKIDAGAYLTATGSVTACEYLIRLTSETNGRPIVYFEQVLIKEGTQ